MNLDSVLVSSIMSNDVKIARYFSRVLCLVVYFYGNVTTWNVHITYSGYLTGSIKIFL
jgi:hypothetical protein